MNNTGSIVNVILLVVIALLPAVVLCAYVFKKDRVEKEPIGLLVKLLLLGALSSVPVVFIGGILDAYIEPMFPNAVQVINTGTGTVTYAEYYSYLFTEYFFGVALVEESVKFFMLIWATRKNKEFNSLFDGIIYAVFVSLGFAALENLLYVFQYGFQTAIMRAVLSVPGHMFYGVMMGYHYSNWHISDKVKATEKTLKARGLIPANSPEQSSAKNIVMCILIPVIAHGFYDFCCASGMPFSMIILLLFVAFMYFHCFGKIRKISKMDALDNNYVTYIIFNKYPYLKNHNQQ